jgi:hypothetical protein
LGRKRQISGHASSHIYVRAAPSSRFWSFILRLPKFWQEYSSFNVSMFHFLHLSSYLSSSYPVPDRSPDSRIAGRFLNHGGGQLAAGIHVSIREFDVTGIRKTWQEVLHK